jgi:hypothetical protein
MSSLEDDFAMQPLSRVRPNCATEWGSNSVMLLRPGVGARVAQYIAEYSEIESLLGLFLALLLHANQKAIMAIWSGIENRAAQSRVITSAAKAVLPQEHFDVISVLMTIDVTPCQKYRDRLAHWNWGYSDELSDALVLREPSDKLINMTDWVNVQQINQPVTRDVPISYERIFVLKETDLDRALKRLEETRQRFLTAVGTIWEKNTPAERAQLLNQLSATPPVRSALDRLAANRSGQKSPPPSPSPKESAGE